LEPESLAYFDEIRHSRYEVTDPWIKRLIDFSVARGKKLLEIGYGVGTDLLTFCENGADVYGIDITEEHYRLAKLNFELHGKQCVLKICDCAKIDFPADYFDVVYTLGVLHHIPDIERCISEIYRVLRPNGQLVMSVYYKYSAYHLLRILMLDGIYRGKLRKLGYKGLLATVEYGSDGVNIKPWVRTYNMTQLKDLLKDFSKVSFKVAHFRREHIPFFGKLISSSMEMKLEPFLGWYLIAWVVK
jgi:ubiquinone/menaquinone biosynthesis C-methylase UbiE